MDATVPAPTADTNGPAPQGSAAEERLLAAARAAFADKGYYGTSTREIAAGAGMSPAAMYICFRSKQDILMRLSIDGHSAALEALRAGTSVAGTPTKRLRAAIYSFAYWHAEHHTTARIVQYQRHALTEENHAQIRRMRRETVQLMRDVIAEGVRVGEFAAEKIDASTLAVMSLCIDIVRWFPSRELSTPEAVASYYATLAGRMLGAAG
ncbi:TetR/AcrR family transcriptional regulator [Nocardia cyriacigeorgica]|uniref:TetR/AcrR family transcriptional regulator n=1 Tax=Nocardia cyriacigeorgica TaxID=135487 RepID=A0A6P1D145_9NOCA|nr:TetR/AcrR family transcriptional regulator [Nocardia cyriacigeorgica]NEW37698.1 TetR/AcrR family transcriptional regulator [Nocardia cyriacigeorgica]NEW43289.1 TetR/AcrR family transcriptional regulator [Nocardia cyriacigeorgica]NEW48916.1 TetR/AcrR family transcriptional regulator [Nocardia cyriacigeorgica]NEW55017.1 TetR/AcrR family transcriptional regulator [Nocardia cyriacigeorgica]